jgi:hypothetical protein
MMKHIKLLLGTLLVVDTMLIMIAFVEGGDWLINSQLSFLSSLFVTLASYYAYKRVIQKRIALDRESFDSRDEMEKIDDPFDLYSDEEVVEERELKEVIKEERAKVTSLKATANNLSKTVAGAFSPWRLLSYLFLFMAFLYLVNNGIFYIWAYISGLFVVPLSVLLFSIMIKVRE